MSRVYSFAYTLVLSLIIFNLQAQQANKPTGVVPFTPAVNPVPLAYGSGVQVSYVRTWDAMAPITDPNAMTSADFRDVKQSTQYVDGLGRPLQTVVKQITPGLQPKDMVSPVIYDEFGRESYKYLPYVSLDNTGTFKMDPFNAQKTFMQGVYTDEQVYYSKTEYEASPLNRVVKTMAPGNSWAGSNRGVGMDYLINTATDGVRIWNIANSPLTYANKDVSTNIPFIPAAVSYAAGELYKNVTTDEAGNKAEEYTNKEGLVVLKKVQSGDNTAVVPPPSGLQSDITLTGLQGGLHQAYNSITLDIGFEGVPDFTAEIASGITIEAGYVGFLSTYYVYDDLNLLRFVIPPKAVAQLLINNWQLTPDIINELCFRYEYDGRKRMIAKKVPGADWVYIIYDVSDRVVFTQDGNQRNQGQWMANLYDDLNRPVLTGMMNWNSGTPAALQLAVTAQTTGDAATTIDGVLINRNPIPSGAPFIALGKIYYDNYNWTNKTFTASYNGLLDAGSNAHAVTMPTLAHMQTTGFVTGSQVRVITDPNNLAAGNWLTTVRFYDNRSRVIQINSETHKGTDILTNLYDFTGNVLCSYLDHTNPTGTPASVHVKTNMEYDHAGRLLEIWKTINDDNTKKALIVKNEYDELSQLINKKLGRKKDLNANYTIDPIETLDYSYNIRGWMNGINKDYSNANGPDRWFGMELNYDKGFQVNQYNGNIGGTKWRSKGDGERRAYGFTYDKTNRILGGDYTQYDGSGYVDNAIINFDMAMGNGIDVRSAYDENGNIKAMKQWGLKLYSSAVIDDLEYEYYNGGNKLKQVKDKAVDASGVAGGSWGLGDFTDKNKNSDDYGYDVNGNLITDLNKKLIGNTGTDKTGGAIAYNHLNLPWKIDAKSDDGQSNKGVITYKYDAAGTKLQKMVQENDVKVNYNNIEYTSDITITTSYVGGFIYESKVYSNTNVSALGYNDRLQFMGQEEGRVRYLAAEGTTPGRFEYDYYVKDHLGNVRMILTEEQKKDVYQAGMELTSRPFEVALFGDKVTTTAKNKSELQGGFDNVSENQIVSKLNGSTAEGRVGPGVILKVMAGDKIKALTYAWYKSSEVDNNTDPGLPSILTSLLSQLGPGITKLVHGTMTGQPVANGILQPGMQNLLGTQTPAAGAPKAYLNWVLLDEEQFKMVDGDAVPVPLINDAQKRLLQSRNGNEIEMTKNGYLYVFVSNESKGDVYFDDIRVEHIRGAMMEETHYYPFGLAMAGISSKAAGRLENKLKFNDATERTSELDLNWDETDFRSYDPQIGRFHQIDPLGGITDNWSPYVFVLNNPMLYNDPLGLDTVKAKGKAADLPAAGKEVNLKNSNGGTSSYIYDPSNANADENGLVENGMTDAPMESVTVVGKRKPKSTTASTPQPAAAPAAAPQTNQDLVIPIGRWLTQSPDWGACFRISQRMAGYTAPPGLTIQTARENRGTLQILPTAQRGVQTINAYLQANRPIIVGVNRVLGGTNNEGTTDHYVVIVGSGVANGMTYYRFFDPGTTRREAGASAANRLYLRENFRLEGTTNYNGRTYTVSQVRPGAN